MRVLPTPPSVSTPPEHKGFHLATFSSLRYRNYRYLWGTSFCFAAGNWIQQVTVGWLIYDMTSSALLTGAVLGIRAIPFLFAGPLAGVLADRVDRKRLIIIAELFASALAFGFAVLVGTGLVQVWHIFVFMLFSGIGWAASNPARQALVPAVVPREALMNAIALNAAAFNATRIAGPAIGGLLIAIFGPATNFFIQSLAYFGVCLLVLPIQIPPRAPATNPNTSSIVRDFKDGVKYVAREPTTLAVIMVALIPSLFMMPFTSGLMPVFAKDVLGVGPEGLGILLASMGIGALIGTLGLASLGNFPRKGALLIAAATLAAVSMMAFSRTTWLPFSTLALALMGSFHMIYNSTNNTVLQLITPDEYRGRVMSIYMADHGLVAAGSLLAGALAELLGAPITILAAGATTVTLILTLAASFPQLRRYR